MKSRELEKIGFSEKEAAVYIALLELGSETVQNIARKSRVNRATTYVILDALRSRGVVSTVEKKKKTHYSAESPEELVRLMHIEEAEAQERGRVLKELLPELKGMYNLAQNKPVVRYYEGREGIRTMQEEFLRSSADEIEMVYSRDHVERAFSEAEREDVRKRRIEKGKRIRALYTYQKGKLSPTSEHSVRRKIPEKKFPITFDFAIIGDKVRIASLGKTLSGIVIEDKEIASSLRSLFNLAWEAAEKYDEE